MSKETEQRLTARDLKAKETKSKIMAASTQLFLDKGFDGVTLSDILKTTGLSKGAFYHHFASKEALYVEMIKELIETFAKIPYDLFDKRSLYNFYIDYINYLESQPETRAINSFQYTTLLYHAMKTIPDLKGYIKIIEETEQQSWQSVVSNARLSGEIDTPMSDEQITRMFLSSSSGIGIKESRVDDADRKMILMDLWNAFYKGLKK